MKNKFKIKINQMYSVYHQKTKFRSLKLLLFAVSVSLMLFACGDQKADLSAKIEDLSAKVYNDSTKRIDENFAKEYVAACEQFASKYPEETQSPALLLKAAETARNVKDFDKALSLYDKIINDFPNYEKAPQAMFLKAFTIDDNMKNKEEAKVLYEAFIQKYPNDEFASSAQFMLNNLYKSDEEIIKEFEANQKAKAGTEEVEQ